MSRRVATSDHVPFQPLAPSPRPRAPSKYNTAGPLTDPRFSAIPLLEAMAARRPLPTLPANHPANPTTRPNQYRPEDIYSLENPYFSPYPHPPVSLHPPDIYDAPATILPGGTLLHKGFYDLLAMIPTPSPSRLIWGAPAPELALAGPRYEDTNPAYRAAPVSSPPVSPVHAKKGRRISKDMVSKPTGFVYVIPSSTRTTSHVAFWSATLSMHRMLTS